MKTITDSRTGLLTVGILAASLLIGAGCATAPIGLARMKTGVHRFAAAREITPEMANQFRSRAIQPDAVTVRRLKEADVRNYSVFLAMLEGKPYLFSYLEYNGDDYEADLLSLQNESGAKGWLQKVGGLPDHEIEEVFHTDGAAEVVPAPGKFSRTGMITGLKAEKEAEYRTLHATTWPGVLKGIRDCHYRDFSIYIADCGGKLYLFGYLEYVGSDPAADDAKGKALPVNKRWWNYTDACQDPLPDAVEKKQIWTGMTEVFHLD
ncbi:MAG: L-rhamnose mutarotase [bacterium]